MATCSLALILKNSLNESQFLLTKQNPPPKFNDEEYDSFLDSDLWDLPSTKLNLVDGELEPGILIEGLESLLGKINFRKYDIESAINRVLEQVAVEAVEVKDWIFVNCVEEPEFGPGLPIHTIYIAGTLAPRNDNLPALCRWMSIQNCVNQLVDVKPCNERVGPLVVIGVINDSVESPEPKVNTTLHHQEYPPGVVIVPMKSRTAKPFHTTNLVIFAPQIVSNDCEDSSFVACGDALIVDPGCIADFHGELFKIVAALSRKLVVFVTHHHHDHVDGLSVIQKCNPNATLLAHENTMRRIGKGDWSLGYTSVSGGEDICIGGQRLKVIFAPGHTDGHVALLHVSTHSLIVGDHCVGQGSSVLDITSGGNMTDYFHTTYKFIDLAPHALIPMHGRVNLWPKHMLCAYLKNRRSREKDILKAIESGAKTLIDIVASVYSEVNRSLWIPAASNVQLHVDHLAQQNKIPKGFSFDTFSCSVATFIDDLSKFEPKNFRFRGSEELVGCISLPDGRGHTLVVCFYQAKPPDKGWKFIEKFLVNGSSRNWIAPKELWHSMGDEEIPRRALAVLQVDEYPYNRTPKIAMMFLTRGQLPLAPFWEMFFKGHKGLYSILLHASPESTDEQPKSSVFHNRRIPNEPVEWGRATVVDAERCLLANADFSNERFVLLSEACIPIFNFTTIYNYFINSNQTFLDSFDDPRSIGCSLYRKVRAADCDIV